MKTNDIALLEAIQRRVGRPFRYDMEGERCVSMDLTSDGEFDQGLIRHHADDDKQAILQLICRLRGLRQLNLRRNKLRQLPEDFRNLTHLEHLNLGSNALGHIPDSLSSLQQLSYLHLGNNELVELPEFIGGFQRLHYLALHKNIRLKNIDALAPLEQLRHLNVHYLNLHRLPALVYRFKELITLTLWNVSEFSDELATLQNIEFFSLCGTPGLRHLPAGLTELKKMRMMRLFQNNLEQLPETIGELENLEQLSLYQNQLFQLPDSFGRLKKLKKLNLGWNRFKFIPECLRECQSLEWLAVFENPLKPTDRLSVPEHTHVLRFWPFTTIGNNNEHDHFKTSPCGLGR